MKLKLDVGIDTFSTRYQPKLSGIRDDEDESPPGTGQKSRTRELSEGAKKAAATAAKAKTNEKPKVETRSTYMPVIVILLAAFGYYVFGGSSVDATALPAPAQSEWL